MGWSKDLLVTSLEENFLGTAMVLLGVLVVLAALTFITRNMNNSLRTGWNVR